MTAPTLASAADVPRWSLWLGAGRTTIDHTLHEEEDFATFAVRDQGAAFTFATGVQRKIAPFASVGLRGAFFRIGTAQTSYCRLTCVPVNVPSNIDVFSLVPAVEVEGDFFSPQVRLYTGGGFGAAVTHRAAKAGANPRLDETDLQTHTVVFAGVSIGNERTRGRVEVVWRRFPDFPLSRSISATLSTVEVGLRVELKR